MARPQHGVRIAIALGLVFAATGVSCSAGAFACDDDDNCAGAGDGGVCEPSGFCSLPDDACDSGRRYGEYAGDGLAGQCVELGGTTSSESGGSSTALSLDGTFTASSDGDTSTTTVDPTTSSEGAGTSTTTDEVVCPPGWWDCDWSYRVPISLGPTTIPPQSGAPVLIRLTGERWDPTTARADALDLRFIGPTGEALAYEIEQAGDPTSVWLSWPVLDDLSAPVMLYWGNAEAGDAQLATDVWDQWHLGVWHMTDTHDSTGALDLVDFGTAETDGVIAGARAFDGQKSHLRSAPGTSLGQLLTGDATIEALIHPLSYGQQGRGRIIDCAIDEQPEAGWTLRIRDVNPLEAGLQLERANEGTETGWTAGSVIVPGTWIHIAMVWAARGQAQMFINGEGVETTQWPGTGRPVDLDMMELAIGRVSGSTGGAFDGWIDEVRVSNVARDPAWLAWQYRSAIDTALVYGDVESLR